jgi:hypothetical protein
MGYSLSAFFNFRRVRYYRMDSNLNDWSLILLKPLFRLAKNDT